MGGGGQEGRRAVYTLETAAGTGLLQAEWGLPAQASARPTPVPNGCLVLPLPTALGGDKVTVLGGARAPSL